MYETQSDLRYKYIQNKTFDAYHNNAQQSKILNNQLLASSCKAQTMMQSFFLLIE